MRAWIVRLRRSCSWLVVLCGKEKGLGTLGSVGNGGRTGLGRAGQGRTGQDVYTIGDYLTARHWVEVHIDT